MSETRFELAIVSKGAAWMPVFHVVEMPRKEARKWAKRWRKVPWGTLEFVAQATFLESGVWWVDTGGKSK